MSPPTARARKANTANACKVFFFMVIFLRYGLPHADDVRGFLYSIQYNKLSGSCQ
jgi:hypothetical protein